MTKKCTSCGKGRPEVKFHKSKTSADGLRSECSLCRNKKLKAWYHKSYKETRAKRLYGIALKDKGKECELCASTVNLHIDHCHKSGKYRGTLCQLCNQGLGLFKDNIETLTKAIEYLKQGLIKDSQSE